MSAKLHSQISTTTLLAVCMLASGHAQAELSCHIHPADTSNEKSISIIGPYPNLDRCEQANAERLLGKGRCHCGFSTNTLLRPRYPSLPNQGSRPDILP